MSKLNIAKMTKEMQHFAKKRSPEILTGIGIVSMISTVVFAVKATPKALELIEEEKANKIQKATVEEVKEWSEHGGVPMSTIDIVKVAWKPFVPVAITGVASAACFIGANSVHAKRNAALATAYQLSTTAFNEYREKVVETIGEKKENKVRDNIAKEKVEKNPVNDSIIIMTGKGNTLCYDSHSDRYFKSDIDKIKNAVLTLNERMINGSEMYISLNEFYDEIGLKHTDTGDVIGWRIDKGKLDVRYSAQLTEDNEPCIVLDHLMPPEYGYDSVY